MTRPAEPPDLNEPGVRYYFLACCLALGAMLLALLPRLGTWALLVAAVGLGSLLLRWRAAPLLLVVLVGALLFYSMPARYFVRFRPPPGGGSGLADLVLCAAVLAFVACNYRLQSLQHFAFPRDPRLRRLAAPPARGPKRPPAPPAEQRRSARGVTAGEVGLLGASLLLWAGLAQVCHLTLVPPPQGGGDILGAGAGEQWIWMGVYSFLELLIEFAFRGQRLIWGLGGGLLLASALLAYASFNLMTRAEANLFLADTLWKETRREQRRINRWLAWQRLREARRKGEA
jgi:hypothetical protein